MTDTSTTPDDPTLPVTRVADPTTLRFVTDPGERRGDALISTIGRGGFHLGRNAVSEDEAVGKPAPVME